jgi:membrane protease YdiL (CAAX protease family)
MTKIEAIIRRRSVLAYYILTFVISWGAVLLVVGGPDQIPGDPEILDSLLPIAIMAMLAGPSTAGLLMTGVVHGRAGFRDLLSRLLKWRVSARWYVVALLTAPLVFTAVSFALSLVSPAYLPGLFAPGAKASSLSFGIAAALAAGLFEELGWTGFATPELRRRYAVLPAGLIMGVLWGAWHILTNDLWAARASAGDLPLALFVIVSGFSFLVGQLVAYRVLMVWVYDRTGSLLVAVLMHASLTASTFILGPVAISGTALLIYGLGLAIAMWVVVAAVAVANRRQLSRQPLQTRVVRT